MGVANGRSLPRLIEEAENKAIDFVLHVGDMAYDMMSDKGENGLAFMRNIEPVASKVAYMTCIGNHEGGTDFDHYSSLYQYMHTFQMPGRGDAVHGSKGNSVYYSFDAGPAHILVFSSEVYFWQIWDAEAQYAFLKADLLAVDREKTPWVVTMAHRPMYCSNKDGDDCTKHDSNMRAGLPVAGARFFRLEELFHEHGVDLAFWAHEHSYERTWPLRYNWTVYNGSAAPYTDPGATVHIIAGAAGCREDIDNFEDRGDWSAKKISNYGYGKLKVSPQALDWVQIDDETGDVVDRMTLRKTMHRFQAVEAGRDGFARFSEQQRVYAKTQACTDRRASFGDQGCEPARSQWTV